MRYSDTYTGLHTHSLYEAHYIYDGGETVIGFHREDNVRHEITVSPKQLVLIPPGFYHATDPVSFVKRFDFRFNIVESVVGRLAYPLIMESELIDDVFKGVERCHKSLAEDSEAYFLRMQFLLSSFVLTLCGELFDDRAPVPKKYLLSASELESDRGALIEEFINTHYSSPTALQDLAALLHLSIRQTQTVVKQLTGKNFKQLILDQKMITAKYIIETTDVKLDEIRAFVGYTWYNSFHTAYVNYYGCSPIVHRLAARENADGSVRNEEILV